MRAAAIPLRPLSLSGLRPLSLSLIKITDKYICLVIVHVYSRLMQAQICLFEHVRLRTDALKIIRVYFPALVAVSALGKIFGIDPSLVLT